MKQFCALSFACMLFIGLSLNLAYAKNVVILLAFGTSDPEAKKALDDIGNAYKEHGDDILWVYSDIVRNKAKSKEKSVFSINEALDEATKRSYKNITIQSLYVTPSAEYIKIIHIVARAIKRNPNRFDSVVFGHPLLMSAQDRQEAVKAMMGAIPKERKVDEAVILMSHGSNKQTDNSIFIIINDKFQGIDPLVWVANVEDPLSFPRLFSELREAHVKRVWLMPFMIVAGSHAKNNMAGTEQYSWTSILQSQGYDVKNIIRGMGELKEIQEIFLRHSNEAKDYIIVDSIISDIIPVK